MKSLLNTNMSNEIRRWMRMVETISDDPHLNGLIQQRLAKWSVEERAPYLDALDAIKTAGTEGATVGGLTSRMARLYPGFDSMIKRVIGEIADTDLFAGIVHRDARGWLIWGPAPSVPDDEPPEDLSRMVSHTYSGLDVMRELTQQQGSFTEDQLAARLAAKLRMARPLAAGLARHLLDQFRSMLAIGNGSYAFGESPRTREENMEFLRSLAKRPQVNDDV